MMVFYPYASEQENLCNVSKPLARRNPKFLHGVIPNLGVFFFCHQQKKDASTKRREKLLRGKRIVGDCRGWSSSDVWKETAQMPDSSPLLEKKSCSFNNMCEASSSHEKACRNGKEEPGSCKASLFNSWRSIEVLTSSVQATLNLKTVTFSRIWLSLQEKQFQSMRM